MIAGLYPIFNHWHQEGTLWCISDPHFGDADLRAGQKNRPSDEEIVARINSKVGRKDTLIILGDVGDIEYAKKLRGRKILVCGNHDKGRTEYKEVFAEIYTGPVMIGEKVILSHEPLGINWAINFHGHVHGNKPFHYDNCYNFSGEAVDFTPINLNQLFKAGLGKVNTIHRSTIDAATKRAKKRGYKYGK